MFFWFEKLDHPGRVRLTTRGECGCCVHFATFGWVAPQEEILLFCIEAGSLPLTFGYDHINCNPPVLIRTPKLTQFEPAQYWGGGPPGNSAVLYPFLPFFGVVGRTFLGG
jgi:hypothetical protein